MGYFVGMSCKIEPLWVPTGMTYWWSVGVTCESCTRPMGVMSSMLPGSRGNVARRWLPSPVQDCPKRPGFRKSDDQSDWLVGPPSSCALGWGVGPCCCTVGAVALPAFWLGLVSASDAAGADRLAGGRGRLCGG